MIQVYVQIEGHVQGVFYRVNTKEKAVALGILGWVQNKPDGSVHAEFQGPENKVNALIDWCHHGPKYADVKNINVKKVSALSSFIDFSIR